MREICSVVAAVWMVAAVLACVVAQAA